MNSEKQFATALEDTKVNVKIKLSALWAALMFIYIYVDLFSFYKPGTVENILVGKVWELDITPTWALSALILMTIPSLMVFFSLALPAKVNRWTNIIVATLYIVVSLGNVIGESWSYLFVGAAVEALLLAAIVWFSWGWPKQAA